MANEFLLAHPEYLEQSGVAITGSAVSGSMAWSQLLNPYPHLKARSSSLSNVFFEVDLGVARDWNFVWLGYTNARSATDWRIRAADTQGNLTAAPNHDSTLIDLWPTSSPSTLATDWPRGAFGLYYLSGSSVNRRWLRIDLADATHPDGYLQAGVLIVGSTFKPARTWVYGLEDPTEMEPTDHPRSIGGVVYPQPGPRPAMASYEFKSLTPAEYRALRKIFRLRGTSKQVITVSDPSNTAYLHENVVHGVLRNLQPIGRPKYVNGGAEYRVELEIESMG